MDWRVIIIPGVLIGDGAIIATVIVVTGNVESIAIVGNQPMRILKSWEREHYENLAQQDKLINNSIQ